MGAVYQPEQVIIGSSRSTLIINTGYLAFHEQ